MSHLSKLEHTSLKILISHLKPLFTACHQGHFWNNLMDRLREKFNSTEFGSKIVPFPPFWA